MTATLLENLVSTIIPVEKVGNSLFINQVNYLLNLAGQEGVSRGYIDLLFKRLSSDQLYQLWLDIGGQELEAICSYLFD